MAMLRHQQAKQPTRKRLMKPPTQENLASMGIPVLDERPVSLPLGPVNPEPNGAWTPDG